MALEFRILGPLETARDGTPIVLAARERALLAVLLVHANEVVSADRLIHELWGEQPPRTAVSALHNAVSRLRKALDETVIQTRTPGYAVQLAGDELDAARFERLLTEAMGASPAEAGDRLREALALWRGPALADFMYEPFAQATIARLEDLHIVAIEERIEADLAIGRHDVLVAELGSLIVDHPFRERLRRQLMVALYRAGRQADALGAYQAARRAFAEELGVEPSPALKEMERAILQHDSSLAGTEHVAPIEPLPIQFAGERRRTVTVVAADVELTHGDAELDPEAFREAISRCFGAVRASFQRYGGTVERLAGDTVIGIFGMPRSHEDDALRAVLGAASARSALVELRSGIRGEWDLELDVRLGINTGDVIEGGTAAPITGAAVGVAKRLKNLAPRGQILLSEHTWPLVRDAVSAEPAKLLADGREPSTAWRVREVRETHPSARHLETPLIGRRRELERLCQAFDRAVESGTGQLVTVLGAAGIGKTRLALELASEVADRATVVSGHCPPFGDGITYWPLTEIVRQAGGSQEAAHVADLVAGAPGAEELFAAARRMLEELAAERPLVVLLEDLHWAEPTFLDLVEHLADWLRDAPVLMLCLARLELLEERPSWGGGKLNATSLLLEPLSEQESNELVDTLSGTADVTAEVRARLVEAADGNPFFVEQLLATLLLGEATTLPPTLQALLAARLDRLGPGERAVVDAAAVAGREFSRPAVEELLPEVAASVERHLHGLVLKELIRPLREPLLGEEAFAFRHVLVRESAYRMTPKARRSHLHRRFAARLDRRVPGFDELVGYHLEQAWLLRAELGPVDDDDRRVACEAGERLGRAGIRAWKRGDVPAAVNLLNRSAPLLPETPYRRELRCELGVAFRAGGDVELAREVLSDVVRDSRAAGDRRLEFRAGMELADLRLFAEPEARVNQLLDLAEEAIPVFETAGDDRSLGRAWLLVGEVRGGLLCDNAAWETAAQRALTHYERSGWPTSTCIQAVTAALYYGPTPVEEAFERCRSYLDNYGSGAGVSALLVMGGLEALRGRFDEARRLAEAARERYLELGQKVRAAEAVDALQGGIELLAGDPSAAANVLRESCERLERMRAFSSLATRATQLAEALYQQGHYDEAEEWTRVSKRHTGADDVGAQFSWRGVQAKVLARRGKQEVAVTLAREGLALAEGTDAVNQHAKALLDLAEVLRLGDGAAEARPVVEQALALYERKGNLPEARRTQNLLAELVAGGTGPVRKAPNGALRTA